MSWEIETGTNTNILATGDPLAIIYNESMWKLNKVSPLHNMRYSPVKLKMYASKVKQAIVSTIQDSAATFTVTFVEMPYLKYTEDDSSGLIITVSSILEKVTTKKIIYMAVLLSWGVCLSIDNATHLPYMLERGEHKVGITVRSTLQNLFDCNIRQFTFTQQQVLQFGFNFVNCDTSQSTEQFTLGYRTPQPDQKEKMNLAFDIIDIKLIWNGSRNESMGQSEQVKLAYQILQNQIFDMIAMDITSLDLSEVTLPKAEVKNNGVVKMKTPEYVNCVLTVLNEISTPLQN